LKLTEEFNADQSIKIFLISTRAGGVGLNITGANKVVIFDPNWNPAHDLQAQDRAFRLGQKRDVSVYRLIAAGTLEEHVHGARGFESDVCLVLEKETVHALISDGCCA
jgi:SNF2 family DNA or RNA helicase